LMLLGNLYLDGSTGIEKDVFHDILLFSIQM
jgi:hypothetical protein